MNKTSNKKLTKYSQELRREMTEEERILWYDFLKFLPVTFNRQKVIGPYIVDFYCAQSKLVIELDGSQHYDNKAYAYDKKRDAYLKSLGLTVVRYSNFDIKDNFDGVCENIMNLLGIDTIKE